MNLKPEDSSSCYPTNLKPEDSFRRKFLKNFRSIRRGRGWSTQYLVRWVGYGSETDTWESDRELLRHVKEIVKEYEAVNVNATLLVTL